MQSGPYAPWQVVHTLVSGCLYGLSAGHRVQPPARWVEVRALKGWARAASRLAAGCAPDQGQQEWEGRAQEGGGGQAASSACQLGMDRRLGGP